MGARKTQDMFESLLHMVHVLQTRQTLRLASKKSSIFLGLIFPADLAELRHPSFFLNRSWARLSFYKKVWMPGTSESEKLICFSNEIDLPKMGILEVDESKPILKLAQDWQQ